MAAEVNTTTVADTDSSETPGGCDCIEIVVAHADESTRATLIETVESLGHHLRVSCDDTAALRDACFPKPPDLILCGVILPGGDAIQALIDISENEPTPAIVVTPQDSLQDVERALRDHVMAYLVEPVDRDQIKPTIYLVCERFKQFELLKAENDDLRQTLADRKVIERAKGILMGQFNATEDEAFRRLQKLAQSKRMKLVTVANALIDAAQSS